MRTLTKYSLCLTLLLSAAILSSGFQKTSQQSESSFLVGEWTLINLSYPDSERTVKFTLDTNLAGEYYASDNKPRSITNAVYKDDSLYFKVPELQIYFEMRKVNDRFEGKMTKYGTNDRRAGEPVRMTKKSQ